LTAVFTIKIYNNNIYIKEKSSKPKKGHSDKTIYVETCALNRPLLVGVSRNFDGRGPKLKNLVTLVW